MFIIWAQKMLREQNTGPGFTYSFQCVCMCKCGMESSFPRCLTNMSDHDNSPQAPGACSLTYRNKAMEKMYLHDATVPRAGDSHLVSFMDIGRKSCKWLQRDTAWLKIRQKMTTKMKNDYKSLPTDSGCRLFAVTNTHLLMFLILEYLKPFLILHELFIALSNYNKSTVFIAMNGLWIWVQTHVYIFHRTFCEFWFV